MNREAVELFVSELESTDLPQAHEALCYESPITGDRSYCALGIGVLVAARELNVDDRTRDKWLTDEGMVWPDPVADFYAIPDTRNGFNVFSADPLLKDPDRHYTGAISNANDALKLPFWEIAQRIRATYLKDEG